jgi:hypothetical protein
MPEKVGPFINGLAERVAVGSNWKVRKKILCDLMLGLNAFFALPDAERRTLMGAAARKADTAEGDGEPAEFNKIMPLYVGAILERMAEAGIESVDQAAVYLFSMHPEHHRTATAWLDAEPRRRKAFRKLLHEDRRLSALVALARQAAGDTGEAGDGGNAPRS